MIKTAGTIVLSLAAAVAIAAPAVAQNDQLKAWVAPYVDNVDMLTPAQLTQIVGILESDENYEQMQRQISTIAQ